MKYKYDIAVIVATYNPVWLKLRATLKSILEQTGIKLQIIVTDDGSYENYFNEVIVFFKKESFKDYKLIANKENRGTVCNYYGGVIASEAEYVKGISPGDLFYNTTILSKWLDFTRLNSADITFCDAVFYNIKSNNLNIIKHIHHPMNMSVYLKPTTYHDKIINYIILSDKISGATIMVRKNIQLHYLELMLNRVIYTEDFFIRLAVLDQRVILYYPHPGIWYEYADGGISTSGANIWKQRIQNDNNEMDNICRENWDRKDETVQKWLDEYYIYNKQELKTRWIKLKLFARHSKWLYFWLYRYLFKSFSPTNVDVSFLRYCFERKC